MNDQTLISEFVTFTEASTLVIQRWLPGPAKRVWDYLVDSDLRQRWLASGDMELAAGAPLELVWRNDTLSQASDPRPAGFPEEQRMRSHVIAVDPFRSLTIAWGKGDVTFELQELGDKVLITLTHRGLEDAGARTMIAAGWHMHLDILRAQVAGGPVPSFWSGWAKYKSEYEARL